MSEKATEFQPEIDAATGELVRRIRAFCAADFLGDIDHFAAAYVAWLTANRWRVIPPPPDWRTSGNRPTAEPNEAWRDARAKITRAR